MNKIYWNTDTDVIVDVNNVIDKSKIPTNCNIYLNFGITVVDCCKAHSQGIREESCLLRFRWALQALHILC